METRDEFEKAKNEEWICILKLMFMEMIIGKIIGENV